MTSTASLHLTDDDRAAARDVLALAADGAAVPVVTLTDEELVILDGTQNDQLVVLPWLSSQDTDPETLGVVALRSLLAHGLVTVAGPRPGSGDDVAIDAAPQITGPLVLRRTATRVLVAHRTVGGVGEGWWYGYRHDATLLEEDVLDSGHHRFAVYPVAATPDRLADFVDPERRATSSTAGRRVSRDALPDAVAREPFADATVVTTLTGLDPESGLTQVVSVYAGPSGLTALRGGDGPDEVVAEGLDRDGVTGLVRGLLAV